MFTERWHLYHFFDYGKNRKGYWNGSKQAEQQREVNDVLAYLHNGKLDYPSRILSYMQDPELHGLIYSSRRSQPYMLI